jgi:hypothetical protein
MTIRMEKLVWVVYQLDDDDPPGGLQTFAHHAHFGTRDEALAYRDKHQRVGRWLKEPLLFVRGPFTFTGHGFVRRDDTVMCDA